MAGEDADEIAQTEAALQQWRQGDATLDGGLFFLHLATKHLPLTREARESLDQEAIEENVFDVFSPSDGLVVVTQTCDIVKACAKSEFVDVSPLVPVSDENLLKVQKGQLIRYAYVPGVADRRLVADLERTMAVEKPVVATWSRVPGCTTDKERVAFADALARKRQRFAFPDGFNSGLVRLKDKLRGKRRKDTPEGRLINGLDHIRAAAGPDWDAPQATVFFWFLLSPDQNINFDESRRVIEGWIKLIALAPPFALADPPFALVEQKDMSVEDYFASHPLDYDDLSM